MAIKIAYISNIYRYYKAALLKQQKSIFSANSTHRQKLAITFTSVGGLSKM